MDWKQPSQRRPAAHSWDVSDERSNNGAGVARLVRTFSLGSPIAAVHRESASKMRQMAERMKQAKPAPLVVYVNRDAVLIVPFLPYDGVFPC